MRRKLDTQRVARLTPRIGWRDPVERVYRAGADRDGVALRSFRVFLFLATVSPSVWSSRTARRLASASLIYARASSHPESIDRRSPLLSERTFLSLFLLLFLCI